MASLDLPRQIIGHVVPQIIKPVLIIGAVDDISRIRLFP